MKKPNAPWRTPKPKTATGTKMTQEQKDAARKRAYEAGRPYPNLVDNMAIIRQSKAQKEEG